MRRLLSTAGVDVRLQFRNGFYYAAGFVVLLWALLATQLRLGELAWLLPALVLGNLVLSTFYFVGGLLLLEKEEGTLQARVVTPLRSSEYLASKLLTLTLLALVENLIIVILLHGLGFGALPLVAGTILASALYVLVGFVAVARYESINEYLLPSVVYTSLLMLPLGTYVVQWESWLLYLHPLQAPLVVMQAAFVPVASWKLLYGLLYGGLCAVAAFIWSRHLFQRVVVAEIGAR